MTFAIFYKISQDFPFEGGLISQRTSDRLHELTTSVLTCFVNPRTACFLLTFYDSCLQLGIVIGKKYFRCISCTSKVPPLPKAIELLWATLRNF